MTLDIHAECAECVLTWRDVAGNHTDTLRGAWSQEMEVSEDFPAMVSTCATYPDSLPNAACWITRDGEPWGFAHRGLGMPVCVAVEH